MRRAHCVLLLAALLAWLSGCHGHAESSGVRSSGRGDPSLRQGVLPGDQAPPPRETGGFDGQRAYEYTAKLVSFGPRPSGSAAITRMQDYVYSKLQADGCQVAVDNFAAQTPLGTIAMRNLVAKAPGSGKGVILLLTHYDTARLPGFVGADDGGSSTGLMLEMAHILCRAKEGPNAVWMAFLDGEEEQRNFQTAQEAQTTWNPGENLYGSRELAARMELSGALKNVKAVLLADMVGQKGLHILRDTNSTPWLTNLVWSTAEGLGYGKVFLPQTTGVEDDHMPFLAKKIPAVDIIDLNDYINEGYWHTAQDTMDKISPKSLAIVGHVMLESVAALQKKFS